MKIRFLHVGVTKNPQLKACEDQYLERLARFLKVERAIVPELKKSDPRAVEAQLEKEALGVEKQLTPATFLIVLDERGEQYSSRKFARFLNKRLAGGTSEVTFLTGGYLGIAERLKQRANRVLSLGRATLPHDLARVVLAEQVYRALTIIRGLPYHK